MVENNSIASVQGTLIKKENSNTNLSVNWNELLKIKLYNECFLEYNIFSPKTIKNITSSRQHNTQEKKETETIIKIITETWI